MSQFSDLFNRFAAAPHFAMQGEDVVYVPHGGTERPIKAIVNRDPPARMTVDGKMVTPRMTVEVQNDATTGISSAELNGYGNDKIRIAYRPGGTAEDFGVYFSEGVDAAISPTSLLLDLR